MFTKTVIDEKLPDAIVDFVGKALRLAHDTTMAPWPDKKFIIQVPPQIIEMLKQGLISYHPLPTVLEFMGCKVQAGYEWAVVFFHPDYLWRCEPALFAKMELDPYVKIITENG